MLREASTAVLVLTLLATIVGATLAGIAIGRRVRHMSDTLSEPVGVLQGALLGVIGLILAFGLSLALSRYEDRRATLVTEANAIGTTWLRAQTLPEPIRSRSLRLLISYTGSAATFSEYLPDSAEGELILAHESALQRRLWSLAGSALDREPVASAPRLYVETLNEMIDAQTSRVAALKNEVPTAVLFLEVVGAAVALGLLAAYLALSGRGATFVLLASIVVALLLLVTFDLDRPSTGPIEIPNTVLVDQLDSMQQAPAAGGPIRVP